MNKCIGVIMLLASATATADSVRSGDLSCTQDDSSPMSVEFDVGQYDTNSNNYNNRYTNDESRVGVKFKYEFGGPKRIDCSRLYDLVIREKQAELAELEAKLKMLKGASNINW